jgi:hypothetical protein
MNVRLAASALLLLAAPALSAEKSKPPSSQPGASAQDAMLAAWEIAAAPGENHRVLDPLVGAWDHAIEWWMSPGAPPEKSTGTTDVRWIMGGRYIRQAVAGVSLGRPFEGAGVMGYDNVKKQYVSAWIDNMGTGLMTATGSYDAAKKTLTETGTFSDPASPAGQKTFRGVTTFKSGGGHTYEMFTTGPDGQEMRMMRIVYTRRK